MTEIIEQNAIKFFEYRDKILDLLSHGKEKWVGEIKYHTLPERRKIKSSYEEAFDKQFKPDFNLLKVSHKKETK